MRSIHVTVEHSRIRFRVWLKATEAGAVKLIKNIGRHEAVAARNSLLARLTASGEYDEVTAGPIPPPGIAPRRPE